MSAEYELVVVPRESTNDDEAILVSWSKGEGDSVREGDVICELEFSKATTEICAPRDGYVFHLREEGDEIPVGQSFAVIATTAERPVIRSEASADSPAIKVTAKARTLIERVGIDVTIFEGLAIVKERHVLAHLEEMERGSDDSAADGDLQPLTPIRRRAAQALSESTRTIPHSYLTRWLEGEKVDARVERLGREQDLMLSVTDSLVANVASAARAFPRVNASWHEDGIFHHAQVNVGFALNLSNGDLIVPVVSDADGLDLEGLVARMRGLQKRAVRHKLSPEELSGGTLTVTSLTGTGVHQVQPIVVPGQAVIVAIGDKCETFGRATYAMTAAFDHRVLNGFEVSEFLGAVAEGMCEEAGGES